MASLHSLNRKAALPAVQAKHCASSRLDGLRMTFNPLLVQLNIPSIHALHYMLEMRLSFTPWGCLEASAKVSSVEKKLFPLKMHLHPS